MIFYYGEAVYYYWFIVFLLGFMMPYYKSKKKSIGLVILLFIIVYFSNEYKSFLPSATPHLYLWHNNNKCNTMFLVSGDFNVSGGSFHGWINGGLNITSCKAVVEDWYKYIFPYKE